MSKQLRVKHPTQADVARRAGVSQAMVSYVLNDNSNISVPSETRQRIQAAMDALGYIPNKAARTLRTSVTRTIACIVPDITNPFHTVFARGVQTVTQARGYELILYNTDRSANLEQSALAFVQQGRVDGVIMTILHLQPEDLLPLLERDVAVVAQGPGLMPLEIEGHALDSLHINDVAAASTAVSHLIEKGHTRIGLLAGQADTPPRKQRERGYRETLAAYGIPVDEELIRGGDFEEEGGYRSMKDLLRISPPITAVFAASDLMAVGALQAIKESGSRVPEDIAVVGFDDIPLAKLTSPSLTTVAQFQDLMGQRAAEMLFARLNGTAPEAGRREEMPYELIVREST